jgi:threonine dehydrogenase-like Zn-dependent dehydrogenase
MTEGGDAQWGLERGKEWIVQGRLRIPPLVTMHVPLDEVERGLDACLAPGKQVLKIAVDIP